MIGSNDCGKGCTWCDGDCQNHQVPIVKEKDNIQKNVVPDLEKIECDDLSKKGNFDDDIH